MKKQSADYQSYSLENLCNDSSFMLWASQPTRELDQKWNSIRESYPALAQLMAEGKKIILSMRFETLAMGKSEQMELWDKIADRTILARKLPRTIRLWPRYAAAAILVGVLFAVGLLYPGFQRITIQTPYGKMQTVTLPDGSQVTLNANSNVKYDRSWDEDQIREVWIEGEAFLRVNHLHKNGPVKDHQRFVVHSGGLNVEVLGTSFNVNNRRGRTEVALLEGKISLGLGSKQERALILAPGDIVEYAGGKLNKTPANVKEYTSWKDGKLYFRNVPLAKVFDYFEDIYGYNVRVEDPKILTRRLSGTVSSSNEKVFFETIARTLNLNITPNKASHELIIKAN